MYLRTNFFAVFRPKVSLCLNIKLTLFVAAVGLFRLHLSPNKVLQLKVHISPLGLLLFVCFIVIDNFFQKGIFFCDPLLLYIFQLFNIPLHCLLFGSLWQFFTDLLTLLGLCFLVCLYVESILNDDVQVLDQIGTEIWNNCIGWAFRSFHGINRLHLTRIIYFLRVLSWKRTTQRRDFLFNYFSLLLRCCWFVLRELFSRRECLLGDLADWFFLVKLVKICHYSACIVASGLRLVPELRQPNVLGLCLHFQNINVLLAEFPEVHDLTSVVHFCSLLDQFVVSRAAKTQHAGSVLMNFAS